VIYFIRDPDAGCVKIGFSSNPALRFNKLKADCANAVVLVAVIEGDEAAESELHQRYSGLNRRGEWFYERGDLASLISSLPPYEKPAGKRVGRSRKFSSTTLADWLTRHDRTDAWLANELGVTRACVSHIRRGIREPSLPLAVRLSRVTGIEIDRLLKAA
jgi:DNA-binding XRE family transcriptional regulator